MMETWVLARPAEMLARVSLTISGREVCCNLERSALTSSRDEVREALLARSSWTVFDVLCCSAMMERIISWREVFF